MALFLVEKALAVSNEVLQVPKLRSIDCRIVDFSDDAVPEGKPDSAGSCLSGSNPILCPVSPSRLDARPSKRFIHVVPPYVLQSVAALLQTGCSPILYQSQSPI